MSLTSTLSNALSGLAAISKSSQVVSDNIANSMTDGFARREINLTAAVIGTQGAGVRIAGVTRIVNDVVLRDLRDADGTVSANTARTSYLKRLQNEVGSPENPGSLSARVANLEAALVAASSRPDSETRLRSVLSSAESTVAKLNSISDAIQRERMTAEDAISRDVTKLNSSLKNLLTLNDQIARSGSQGNDTSALEDLRQTAIDDISRIIPVRELETGNGRIALYSFSGQKLVDGTAATFEFAKSNWIAPNATIDNGSLSGLTIDGRPLRTSSQQSQIEGGSLSAQFEIRDRLAIIAQEQLDAVSRDLLERVGSSTVDGTISGSNPGIFTDGGGAFDPANEIGISSRISIHANVDPDQGGELWRLRDGVYASVEGLASDSSVLSALTGAIDQPRSPASGGFASGARSHSELVSDLISNISGDLLTSEASTTFSLARKTSLQDAMMQDGVDTDQEMQKLMTIERAYAANARVITAVDQMMKRLLEM